MPLFCCSSIRPYRPQHLAHESKFTSFVTWASFPTESRIDYAANLRVIHAPFAIQLVRQVNYGPLESKRYFIPHTDTEDIFNEVVEDDLIQANFQKLNAYAGPRQFFFLASNDRALGTRTSSAKYTISFSSLMCIRRTLSISTTGEPTWRDRRGRSIYHRRSGRAKQSLP